MRALRSDGQARPDQTETNDQDQELCEQFEAADWKMNTHYLHQQ